MQHRERRQRKILELVSKNECTLRAAGAKNEVQAHGREEPGSVPCLCVAGLPAARVPRLAGHHRRPSLPHVTGEEPSQGQQASFSATVTVSYIKTKE